MRNTKSAFAALSIIALLSACDDSTSSDRKFSIGGPSNGTYLLGRTSPQNYPRAMSEAQKCVWSNAKNCGVKIHGAQIYARSDYEYYATAKMDIEYWMAQGQLVAAQKKAVTLLRVLPGNSFALDFLEKHPPAPADIGLSRGTLLGLGLVILAGSGAPAAVTNAARSRSASVQKSQNSVGYRITERIAYGPSQAVIARGRCNNGTTFDVRYYPGNGNGAKDHGIGSEFGASVNDVAGKFCS